MNAHAPAFALFCGDLVAGSSNMATTVAEWADWDTATAGLTAPRFMVPGNHDMYPGAGAYAAWRTAFPWLPTANSPAGEEGATYFFDAGNTRIVSLATDFETGGGAPNQAWLDGVLQSSSGFDHVFVFSHRPIMFSASEPTGGSGGPLWQSMVQAGVTGYFSGHWHRYQPDRIGAGGDTWEVLIGTGGGWQGFQPIRPYQQIPGYLVVDVDGARATATFYGDADNDGEFDDPMDRFVMKQPGPGPEGLVAEYTFEDGAATDTALPPLGKGIDGALRGDAAIGAGIEGNFGLDLDGVDDHVEAGAIGDYNLSLNGALTIGAFASYRSLSGGPWDNPLLCYGTADYYSEDEETNYSYWFSMRADRTLRAWWEYGNGVNVLVESTVPAPVAAAQAHHYAFTRDPVSMEVAFYVDGALLGSPVSFPRLPTSGGRGMLYIGSDTVDFQAGEVEWDGVIDSVRIYNRALSATEIVALADPGPTYTVQNAVAGQTASLRATQCEPASLVYFLYSLAGTGPTPTVYGVLDLSPPIGQVTSVLADAQGVASHSATVPLVLAGRSVTSQALEFQTAGAFDVSNPVPLVIQ